MREIKFRAWLVSRGLMDNWEFLHGRPLLLSEIMCSPNKHWILMQYTGLKDKNGKEIYEGDILGLAELPEKDKQTEFGRVKVIFGAYDDSEIEYGSPAIGWYVTGYHGYNRLDGTVNRYEIDEHSLLTVCDKYEIIGNIYETPELIKV